MTAAEPPPEVRALAERRLEARAAKDFAESDRLRDELAAAWARAGHQFASRQGLGRVPFEALPPERRGVLLAVAGAVVQDLAAHRSACGPSSALLHCVRQ